MNEPADQRPEYVPAALVDYGTSHMLVQTDTSANNSVDDGGGIPVYTS